MCFISLLNRFIVCYIYILFNFDIILPSVIFFFICLFVIYNIFIYLYFFVILILIGKNPFWNPSGKVVMKKVVECLYPEIEETEEYSLETIELIYDMLNKVCYYYLYYIFFITFIFIIILYFRNQNLVPP
jgi:hypothetical protein